ncbi:hypothetical protein [Micromonospora sp. RP3T]|uniref:hypothetical protein n=1 Tax=Micromonospora sp. RP3T TaxID=2135446 RepID=UPI000D167445|nr:hypothetical protein [Micromonospora sp. RP3T]PTA43736.1 hypothetical protein C8054_24255 [Micromonospora sp. RP3T]
MHQPEERILLNKAFATLAGLIEGDDIRLVRQQVTTHDAQRDDVWRIEAPHSFCDVAVQGYRRFTPRHADQLVTGVSQLMRAMREQPVLVVAPWLSPRSRELLIEQKINYLDLTGNVWVRLRRPMVVIRTAGAERDPQPTERPPVQLQGKGVNALIRVLVDVQPPYRMVQLARATGLSPGYVSRTLEALDEERLIDRGKNRLVLSVDWQGLLRRRAEHYSLVKTNHARGYLARTGLSAFTRTLTVDQRTDPPSHTDAIYQKFRKQQEDQALVTGSFAAREYVRIAAPAQLALYVPDPEQFADRHGLMQTDRGANVLLMTAADPSQLQRVRLVDGLFHVGISQLAQDCLAGNGRLPEEGDALIGWMTENVAAWRRRALEEY